MSSETKRKWFLRALSVIAALGMTGVARADHVSYTFDMEGLPGIGSFVWTVTTADLISNDTSFVEFNSITSPAGCSISSVRIANVATSVLRIDTMFSPLCNGFDANTTGLPGGPIMNPGEFINTCCGIMAKLTVFSSNLPVTTPEPGYWPSLGVNLGLLAVAMAGAKRIPLFRKPRQHPMPSSISPET